MQPDSNFKIACKSPTSDNLNVTAALYLGKLQLEMSRDGPDGDFLIFADADRDADTYFQYLWMRIRILKIIRILAGALSQILNNETVSATTFAQSNLKQRFSISPVEFLFKGKNFRYWEEKYISRTLTLQGFTPESLWKFKRTVPISFFIYLCIESLGAKVKLNPESCSQC